MTDSRYLQDELDKKFDHLAEECGEFITAYSKMRRWGAFSYNPEAPLEQQEYNIDWVEREIVDIHETLKRLREALLETNDEELEEIFPGADFTR